MNKKTIRSMDQPWLLLPEDKYSAAPTPLPLLVLKNFGLFRT